MIIETERLTLRPMKQSDATDLLEYQSNADIVRYIPWPEGTPETVQKHIERTLNESTTALKEDGEYLVLVWELKSNRKIIGQSNLNMHSKEHECAEIGWVTHQDFQRQGFAREASRAVLDYAFGQLNFHRVIASMDTRVPESAAVAKSLGMRLEAEMREAEFFKGSWCDMWTYAILKSEFLTAK
jgi:aminoglycoside 6'-N-acetyltransferase